MSTFELMFVCNYRLEFLYLDLNRKLYIAKKGWID